MEKKSRWDSDDSDDEREKKPKKTKLAPSTTTTAPEHAVSQSYSTSPVPPSELAAPSKENDSIEMSVVSDSADKAEALRSSSPLLTEQTETTIAVYNPLFQGCRSVEEYQRLDYIDQGTYGAVFKARCRNTGELVALKQVKLDATANVSKLVCTISPSAR